MAVYFCLLLHGNAFACVPIRVNAFCSASRASSQYRAWCRDLSDNASLNVREDVRGYLAAVCER